VDTKLVSMGLRYRHPAAPQKRPPLRLPGLGAGWGASTRKAAVWPPLSFREWCRLNSFSEATGRRLIRKGKVKIVRLSERRIGISEGANADFQAACLQAGE
jgi:hypothetical protein